MKVFELNNFSVHVFPNDHAPPHCHVIFRDGSDLCIGLLFVEPLYGGVLSRKIRKAIMDHQDDLASAWDKFNLAKK